MKKILRFFELSSSQSDDRPTSTLALDSLYVVLSLMLTVGIMLDVWSHLQYGPDQSVFNEYHLLFYGSVGSIMILLVFVWFNNWRSGYSMITALPHGYGLGLFAVLWFSVSGVIDLAGHAMFGFESDMEALTSPLHLLLFIGWFMILFVPVNANLARMRHFQPNHQTFAKNIPMLFAYACIIICMTVPFQALFPMGNTPFMLQSYRTGDDFFGLVAGIGGTLFQTVILISLILWLARHFRLPVGSYTFVFFIHGLFITIIDAWQMPWLMFGGLGLILDAAYSLLKPDGTRRPQFILFAVIGAAGMWLMTYTILGYVSGVGINAFYYSGYNLYGSVAQGVTLAALLGYIFSMTAPQSLNTQGGVL